MKDKKRSRPISVGFPSGRIKMALWDGTEDEESFFVHGLKTKTPYVKAYGVVYYLTEDETKTALQLRSAMTSAFAPK